SIARAVAPHTARISGNTDARRKAVSTAFAVALFNRNLIVSMLSFGTIFLLFKGVIGSLTLPQIGIIAAVPIVIVLSGVSFIKFVLPHIEKAVNEGRIKNSIVESTAKALSPERLLRLVNVSAVAGIVVPSTVVTSRVFGMDSQFSQMLEQSREARTRAGQQIMSGFLDTNIVATTTNRIRDILFKKAEAERKPEEEVTLPLEPVGLKPAEAEPTKITQTKETPTDIDSKARQDSGMPRIYAESSDEAKLLKQDLANLKKNHLTSYWKPEASEQFIENVVNPLREAYFDTDWDNFGHKGQPPYNDSPFYKELVEINRNILMPKGLYLKVDVEDGLLEKGALGDYGAIYKFTISKVYAQKRNAREFTAVVLREFDYSPDSSLIWTGSGIYYKEYPNIAFVMEKNTQDFATKIHNGEYQEILHDYSHNLLPKPVLDILIPVLKSAYGNSSISDIKQERINSTANHELTHAFNFSQKVDLKSIADRYRCTEEVINEILAYTAQIYLAGHPKVELALMCRRIGINRTSKSFISNEIILDEFMGRPHNGPTSYLTSTGEVAKSELANVLKKTDKEIKALVLKLHEKFGGDVKALLSCTQVTELAPVTEQRAEVSEEPVKVKPDEAEPTKRITVEEEARKQTEVKKKTEVEAKARRETKEAEVAEEQARKQAEAQRKAEEEARKQAEVKEKVEVQRKVREAAVRDDMVKAGEKKEAAQKPAKAVGKELEVREDKTEEVILQLKQVKPEEEAIEAEGPRQETEQAPLVKEVSAERASEEELLDRLGEVLSHTRYKRWADVNARVSLVRRIQQVNRGERDSVKMSFHSKGEYRRTVEALKRLEEIGFIRLRLTDVPEGQPAGGILNAIFAGYKLEILPPAEVVPGGESLLSEPESAEEVVVAGEKTAESTVAEATKAKYNFTKARDLLALGIYNRFIPALPEEKAKILQEVLEKWKEATDPAKNLDVLIVEKLNEIAKDNDGLRVWAKGGLETYRCWFVALGIEFPIVDKMRPVREMIGEGQNILAQVEHVNRINNFRSLIERALDTYRGQQMAVEREKKRIESCKAILKDAESREKKGIEDRVKQIEGKLLEAEAGLVLAEKNVALAKNELGRLLEISPQDGFELSEDLLEITTAKIEEELKELREMAGEIGIVETHDTSRTFPGQIQAVRNALESLNNKYKEVNSAWSNIRFRGELSFSALFQFYQSDLGLIFSRGEKYSPMALMHLKEAVVYGNEATLRDIREALDRAGQKVKNAERLHEESLAVLNKAEEYLKKARQATEKGYLSKQHLIRAKELLREARELKATSLADYTAAARTYDELNKGWSEFDKIGDFCNRVEEFVRKDKKELNKEDKRVQKEIISTMKTLLGEIKNDKKLIAKYESNPDWKYAIGYIQEVYNSKVKELKSLKNTLEASLTRDSKKEKKLRDEIGGLKELAVESKVTEKVEPEKGTAASYVLESLKKHPRLMELRSKTEARKWQYLRFLREVNDKFFLFKLIDGIFGIDMGTISTVGGRLEGSIKLGREDACKLKLYEKLWREAEAEEKMFEAGLAEEARNAYLDWIRSEAQHGLFLRDIKVIDNHIELKKELLIK
ncbi:MAG TPA: TolC family protein, partial [bacterium]|nr:TolC family protein [bacterium]